MIGSRNESLLAKLLSNESNKLGNSSKFAIMANNSVIDTSPPNAMVPP